MRQGGGSGGWPRAKIPFCIESNRRTPTNIAAVMVANKSTGAKLQRRNIASIFTLVRTVGHRGLATAGWPPREADEREVSAGSCLAALSRQIDWVALPPLG